MDYKELLIGCGTRKDKQLSLTDDLEFKNVVTLDYNSDHNPDILYNLENLPYEFAKDNEYDEIHAYEVLEHTGAQGDWRFFFEQFNEFHRILKPNGLFFASVPRHDSIWAWGDPSHKRVFPSSYLTFLSQEEYKNQVGKTSMSDFRFIYKGDFVPVVTKNESVSFIFVLKALK